MPRDGSGRNFTTDIAAYQARCRQDPDYEDSEEGQRERMRIDQVLSKPLF
jgi:hypothetical protein